MKIIYSTVLVFLVLIAGLLTLSALNIPAGTHLYTVESASMSPAIPVGSLIISQSQSTYQIGDIVTFMSGSDTITHRLVDIKHNHNRVVYVTQGDANHTHDVLLLTSDLILGKTIFSIPLLGYPISFARTQLGFIVIIIIPSTLIIYSELLNIKAGFFKLFILKRKKHRP